MTKYIVSFGEHNVCSVTIPTILKGNKPDWAGMYKRVKEWAKDGTVELAS
jgi:hypothetical protein